MIEQYLSNTNEIATVLIFAKNFGTKQGPRKQKTFQDSPSHRILGYMHEALDIDENKNQLHSSHVNHEMNLLRPVSP